MEDTKDIYKIVQLEPPEEVSDPLDFKDRLMAKALEDLAEPLEPYSEYNSGMYGVRGTKENIREEMTGDKLRKLLAKMHPRISENIDRIIAALFEYEKVIINNTTGEFFCG